MLSANNSSWAASWLVGSAIVVSTTGLSALDANTMGYSSQDSYPQGDPYSQSSGYDGWGEYSYGSGRSGYNDLNGVSGINGLNGINGINGLNGLNANDELRESSGSSASYYYDREAENVRSPSHGVDIGGDTAVDLDDTNTQPFGGATTGGSTGDDGGGDIIRLKQAGGDTPVVPQGGTVDETPVPRAPVYPAEWNVPEGAPGYGPVVYPIYPPTWKYPPLVEKVSVGLSSVGVDEPDVSHRAAPELLPPPYISEPPPVPEPPVSLGLAGIVTSVVDFFKSLWPF